MCSWTWTGTLSSLDLPLSSSSTTSRELLRNSRLAVDEDDVMWFENERKLPCIGKNSFMEIFILKPLVVGKLCMFPGM